MQESLYDKLGGFTVVRKLVSDFYDRVLDDELLSPFFDGTDMASLIDHQTKFFAMLLGGPASYTDKQLVNIHSHMGINDHHFDRVTEILMETLEDLDIDEAYITQIADELRKRRSSIANLRSSK